MHALADLLGNLTLFGARIGAFEQTRELVAAEREEPRHAAHVAPAQLSIEPDEVSTREKILPGLDQGPLAFRITLLPPTCQDPTEIEHRIAERGELPVDDTGNTRRPH